MCKIIISPNFLFIFSKFVFSGFVGTRAKTDPKWQEILSVVFHISGIIYHMIFIYGTLCEMIISLGVYFHVFKVFDFVGS